MKSKPKYKKKKPSTWVDLDLWIEIKKFNLEMLRKIHKQE